MVCHCRYWTIRNNSSNISAVLHSKPFYRKTKHDCYQHQQQEQSQLSKTSFSHNSCYCHLRGVKPKLFTKPKHCPCESRIKAPPPIKIKHPPSCSCHKHPSTRLTYRKSNFFDQKKAKTTRDDAEDQLVERFKGLTVGNREDTDESSNEGQDADTSYKKSKEKRRYSTNFGRKPGNFIGKKPNFPYRGYGGEDSEVFYKDSKEKHGHKTNLARKERDLSNKMENFASGEYSGEDSEDFDKNSQGKRGNTNFSRKSGRYFNGIQENTSGGYIGEDSEGFHEDSKQNHRNKTSFRGKNRDFNEVNTETERNSRFDSRNHENPAEFNQNQRDHSRNQQKSNNSQQNFQKSSKYRTFSDDFEGNISIPTSSRLPADDGVENSSRAVPKVQTTTSRFHPNTNSAGSRLRVPNDRITSKHQDPDLKQITDFRKDHYFETHSTEDLTRTAFPPHKCVHSFEVDSRFLPKALNCDEYGQSRCIICGRMMENPRKTSNSTDSKKNSGNFPEYYKHGLAPRKIFIGQGDYDIQIDLDNTKRVFLNSSRPNYFNTLALKYQKGVQI